jgi:hypothetical protein
MTATRFSLLTFSIFVLSGCGSGGDSQVAAPESVASAALAKKPSKKCASCAFYLDPFNNDSMQVVDVSEPGHPVVVSYVDVGWSPDMIRNGDYAYVSYLGSQVYAIDLTDPYHPISVSFAYNEVRFIHNLQIAGNRLYYSFTGEYGDSPSGIGWYDLTDPAHPR